VTFFKVLFLTTIFLISTKSFAKPSDSDLVVPTSSAQSDLVVPNSEADAEQDAIHARHLHDEEVSDDIAQKRIAPPKDKVHTSIIEYTKEDDDGATESAAGSLKEKVRNPPNQPKPSKHYASFHIGSYDPTQLMGDTSGITYSNVYGSNSVPMFQFDYEWDFFRTFGKLGLKSGIGFFTAEGDGRFVQNPNIQSQTELLLIVLPFTEAAVYHFEYWDRQLFVPYAEAGVDYFGIFEIPTEATTVTKAKFGGSAAAHYAAGMQFQIDFLDREGLFNMFKDYGITHMYVTAGIRQFVGLGLFDFSAVMFEGGFSFEF
jgi:hypothetical protein